MALVCCGRVQDEPRAQKRFDAQRQVLKDDFLVVKILSYLDYDTRKGITTVSKRMHDMIPLKQHFQYHDCELEIEKIRAIYENNLCDRRFMSERHPYHNASPIHWALRDGYYEEANFYLEKGAHIDTDFCNTGYFYIFYFDHPYPRVSRAVLAAYFKKAMINKKLDKVMQEPFNEAARYGKLEGLQIILKTMKRHKISFSVLSLFDPLKSAVRMGFIEGIELMLATIGAKQLSLPQKMEIVALALELGYPELLPILEKHKFPITQEQRREAAEQIAFIQKCLNNPRIMAPRPLNAAHSNIHGKDNEDIYQREYQKLTAYILYRIEKKGGCDFVQLIENLGKRRQAMAIKGNLDDLQVYGVPCEGLNRSYTPFGKAYARYGEKAARLYGKDGANFNVIANTKIGNRTVGLSQISNQQWLHPAGFNREIVLKEIAAWYQRIHQKYQADTEELAKILYYPYWLFSQQTLFFRGAPTIIAALTDAFWLHQARAPMDRENDDINCEALVYTDYADFVEDFLSHKPMPPIYNIHS